MLLIGLSKSVSDKATCSPYGKLSSLYVRHRVDPVSI